MADRNVEALTAPLYIGNGADRTKIATDGTITLEGAATFFEDLEGHIGTWSLDGAAGKADFDTTERLIVLEPSGSLSTEADVVYAKYQLRHRTKDSTNLALHLHWRQSNATIEFQWKYRVVGNNGAASTTAWTTGGTIAATGANNAFSYTSGNLDQITKFGNIDTTGLAISSIIQVKFTRTDATAGNIFIYDLDCHFESDRLGSSTEYTK